MFARLDSFEAMLYNSFDDVPRKKLAGLLRLWVNMLRSGKLITTDIVRNANHLTPIAIAADRPFPDQVSPRISCRVWLAIRSSIMPARHLGSIYLHHWPIGATSTDIENGPVPHRKGRARR